MDTRVRRDGRMIELKNIEPRKVIAAINAAVYMGPGFYVRALDNMVGYLIGRQEAVVEDGRLVEVNRYNIYY